MPKTKEITLYKLTDAEGYTRRGCRNGTECKWGRGVSHVAHESGVSLCTPQVIHAYRHPVLAVLFNPRHAAFSKPLLWEARGEVVVEAYDKCGVKKLTTVKKIKLPEVNKIAATRFAIACALEVYKDIGFVKWAHDWLNNKDRSYAAANAAANAAAYDAANAAAYDAAARAANAASFLTKLPKIAAWCVTTKKLPKEF